MVRMWLAVLAGLVFASAGSAQAPWQFRWKAGEVLPYRSEQAIVAAEVVQGSRSEISQKVKCLTSWKVLAVDAQGTATLEKTLVELRLEQKVGTNEVLVFDSTQPEQSDKQLREELSKSIGKPLVTLRVDSRGRVVEVRGVRPEEACRHERELPFGVSLPESAAPVGQSWQRTFTIALDPPQGTGEKYQASQQFTLKGVQGPRATIALTTAFASLPAAAADRIPLLQYTPTGEVTFDTEAGRVRSIRLEVAHELKDHQGEGSSYAFKRTYVEQFVGK